jgi:NAD(P)-dependent dehydrogenase (short-subunit alcohol dehydrogenase family)
MTAIVTGAASGIGLACVRRLATQGAQVVAVDRDAEVLARALGDAPACVHRLAIDVADRAACVAGVDQAMAQLGHLDALMHFAGIWAGTQWLDSAEAEWDRIIAVNLKGSFHMAQAAATHMARRRQGSIVLTASDSVNVGGVGGGTAYVSSKGGVIGLCRSLARNIGGQGIRVNAINPGVVDTPMTASWSADPARPARATRGHRRCRNFSRLRRRALRDRGSHRGQRRILFRLAAGTPTYRQYTTQ